MVHGLVFERRGGRRRRIVDTGARGSRQLQDYLGTSGELFPGYTCSKTNTYHLCFLLLLLWVFPLLQNIYIFRNIPVLTVRNRLLPKSARCGTCGCFSNANHTGLKGGDSPRVERCMYCTRLGLGACLVLTASHLRNLHTRGV